MLTYYGHTLAIDARGQKWRGTWELDGKDVTVTSAFGSARVPKGRKAPQAIAEAALRELVEQWATRQ
jgi:hypothetical protein